MSEDTNQGPATPSRVPCNDLLGPLPEAALTHDRHGHALLVGPCFTGEQMRAYAAQEVAAERERWQRIRVLADECAEWHVSDGDECGEIARELLSLLRT